MGPIGLMTILLVVIKVTEVIAVLTEGTTTLVESCSTWFNLHRGGGKVVEEYWIVFSDQSNTLYLQDIMQVRESGKKNMEIPDLSVYSAKLHWLGNRLAKYF